MMFPEYQEPVQLWRQVASGYMTDPAWTFITTISGRFEPVSPSEEFLQNQSFANVVELLFSPVTYKSIVLPGDGSEERV